MTDWQPMDTAPRDGTPIRLKYKDADAELTFDYRWEYKSGAWTNGNGSYVLGIDSHMKEYVWRSIVEEKPLAEAHFRLVLQLIASGSTDELAVSVAKMALRKYP